MKPIKSSPPLSSDALADALADCFDFHLARIAEKRKTKDRFTVDLRRTASLRAKLPKSSSKAVRHDSKDQG